MISLSAALSVLVLLSCTTTVNGLNILQICPGFSQSHVIFNHKLADTLHRAGHNVTILNMIWMSEKLGNKKPPKGVTEIRVEPDYPPGVVQEMNDVMQDYAFNVRNMLKYQMEGIYKIIKSCFLRQSTRSNEDPFSQNKTENTNVVETLTLLSIYQGGAANYRQFNIAMTSAQMTKLGNIFINLTSYLCQYMLDQTDLLTTLNDNNYDVTLSHFFNLCPVGLNKMLNIPKFIWVAPGTFIMDYVADVLSLPNLISYIPYSGGDYSDKMSFLERLKNFLWVSFNLGMSRSKMSTVYYENQIFKRFPNSEKFPDLYALASENTQGLLVNGEDFLDFPRPITHGLVHIGELGHKDAGKLPEEWEKVMDTSSNGVILFSLGTIANTTLMPMKLKDAFLDAFSSFHNYTIIWRLEGEMPQGLAEQNHIKIVTWTPQKELINHPKFKLFITHGGYNSLLETAQAGVPMILMPLFNDQYPNAHRAVRHGLGLMLDKLNPDSTVIRNTISEVLNNDKYRENAKKFSTILQDKFIPNEISMVKFIEKIVQTKNWPTMKMAQRLNFFQYYCLDVLTLMMLSFLLLFYATSKIFLKVFRFIKKFK